MQGFGGNCTVDEKNDQIDAERIVWVSLSTAMRVGFGGKTGCGGTAFSSPCV